MKVKFCPKNGLNLALEPPEASKWAKGPWKRTPNGPPQLPLNNLSPFEEDFVGRGFAGDDFVFVFFFVSVFVFVFVFLLVFLFVFFPVFVFVRDEEDYVSRGFGGDD